MDPEKPHTINPLMRKKQAREAESSSQFSSFSQSDSGNNLSAHDNITAEHFATKSSALDNLSTTNKATASPSHASLGQFNLRPSTNPVSDFRRRRSYKGLANPTNTPHRQSIDHAKIRPPLVFEANSSPANYAAQTKPAVTLANDISSELDTADIQNMGVKGSNNKSVDPDAIAELLITENKAKNKKSHRKPLLIISGLFMVASIAIVVTLLLMKFVPRHNPSSNSNNSNSSVNSFNTNTQGSSDNWHENPSSASEKSNDSEIPKTPLVTDIIDEAVEVNVLGLSDSVMPNLGHKIVKVSFSNKSADVQSVKISLAAMDQDGKIIDVSSLYTEGIKPGETYELEAFVSTSLTDDQLGSAIYKIRSASTYNTKLAPSGETE